MTSTQSSCNWIKEEMRILGILDIIANRGTPSRVIIVVIATVSVYCITDYCDYSILRMINLCNA